MRMFAHVFTCGHDRMTRELDDGGGGESSLKELGKGVYVRMGSEGAGTGLVLYVE